MLGKSGYAANAKQRRRGQTSAQGSCRTAQRRHVHAISAQQNGVKRTKRLEYPATAEKTRVSCQHFVMFAARLPAACSPACLTPARLPASRRLYCLPRAAAYFACQPPARRLLPPCRAADIRFCERGNASTRLGEEKQGTFVTRVPIRCVLRK